MNSYSDLWISSIENANCDLIIRSGINEIVNESEKNTKEIIEKINKYFLKKLVNNIITRKESIDSVIKLDLYCKYVANSFDNFNKEDLNMKMNAIKNNGVYLTNKNKQIEYVSLDNVKYKYAYINQILDEYKNLGFDVSNSPNLLVYLISISYENLENLFGDSLDYIYTLKRGLK